MMEWWIELNMWAKLGVSSLFIGAGIAELVLADIFRPWTWGVGFVLLFFSLVIDNKSRW